MTIKGTIRAFFGMVLFLGGAAIIFAEVNSVYRLREEPHYVHLGLGVLISWAGGYILKADLAEAIGKRIADFVIAVLPVLPGGRRRYDPPAPVTDVVEKFPPEKKLDDL